LIYWFLFQENRNKLQKTAITLLQVKKNLTTSAKSTKTVHFDRKIFSKKTLIKLAQKSATRNSEKFPATQRKNQPNCAGKPPNWQHCLQ